jgi:hypothetical protein
LGRIGAQDLQGILRDRLLLGSDLALVEPQDLAPDIVQ